MANEAILRDRLEDPIDFTVGDGTGIEKGAVLEMQDPRTAIAVTAANKPIAGIAAREKVADDGHTRLAVFRKGIFDMLASGVIKVGDPVSTGFPTVNGVVTATGATASGAVIIGHALETAADHAVIQIYVDVGAGVTA